MHVYIVQVMSELKWLQAVYNQKDFDRKKGQGLDLIVATSTDFFLFRTDV